MGSELDVFFGVDMLIGYGGLSGVEVVFGDIFLVVVDGCVFWGE